MRGANQAEVPLVDQVAQRDALILVLLRDGDDEAKIGAHECVERFLIVPADFLGELNLLLPRDQRKHADVAEVLVERSFFVRMSFVGQTGHVRV